MARRVLVCRRSRSCSWRSFQPAPAAGPRRRRTGARHRTGRHRRRPAARAMTFPTLEGYELAVDQRDPHPDRRSRARTTGSSGRTTRSRRSSTRSPSGSPGRARSVPQPLARHPAHGVRPAAAQHLRARRPAQHRRALVGRGHRARPGRGPGHRPTAGGGEAPGYQVNGTIMRLRLPKPLPPGGRADFEFDWRLRVPPDGAPRGGQDGEVWYINYWYPQMAVYDDVNGWQIDQYLGNAEFYMGYGNYDVSPHRPGGLAGDRDRTAAEPRRGALRPDPRAARLGPRRQRHRARGDRAGPRAGPVDHRRHRRQAHLALPGRERARRRLGHLGALPVGRDHRRRRATPTATASPTRR